MDSSISVAVSAQRAILRQLDVVANNVANSNTVGYRAEAVDFRTVISNATPDRTHFVEVSGIQVNNLSGALTETANPLDVAISGEGYFSLLTPAGQVYTRDGRLKVSATGELQSIEGHPVVDAGGGPIFLANGGRDLTVHPDGRVAQGGKIVANIGVFNMTEEMIAARSGNSAFLAKQPPEAISLGKQTSLVQGFVENSNTNPMMELANLITLQRNFESISSLIEKADGVLGKSISELARVR